VQVVHRCTQRQRARLVVRVCVCVCACVRVCVCVCVFWGGGGRGRTRRATRSCQRGARQCVLCVRAPHVAAAAAAAGPRRSQGSHTTRTHLAGPLRCLPALAEAAVTPAGAGAAACAVAAAAAARAAWHAACAAQVVNARGQVQQRWRALAGRLLLLLLLG
jgi:hypothetical protein